MIYKWKKQIHSPHNHKLQSSSQFNLIQSVRFVSLLLLLLSALRNQRGVPYNTLSCPFFIVIYFKLVHNKTSQERKKKKGLLNKIPTFVFPNKFLNNLIKKREKNLTNYCQDNWTLELCYVRDFVVRLQRTSNCKDYTTYLHLHRINLRQINLHQKIGFSSSGLFIN